MVAVEDRQQLAELIDAADIAVRVASQLRLLKGGHGLRDAAAITRAIEFLDTAIAGGQFLTTGNISGLQSVHGVSGLQSTLEPLTWAADVRFTSPALAAKEPDGSKYDELIAFLAELRTSLQKVIDAEAITVQSASLDAGIDFFGKLGTILGTKADQSMRKTSNAYTTALTMMV